MEIIGWLFTILIAICGSILTPVLFILNSGWGKATNILPAVISFTIALIAWYFVFTAVPL